MTNVRMKANDTLHISSVRADNIQPGEEFEVAGHIAEDLEKRGLAVRAQAKDEPAPSNKAEPAAANKSAKPAAKKDS